MATFSVIIIALLPLISAAPIEILNYDAGTHSRIETGIPGQAVEGAYSFFVDGKEYKVSYQADADGFRAQGDHLPVAPVAAGASMMEETAGNDAPVAVPEEAVVAIESAEVEPAVAEEIVESTESPVVDETIVETTEVVLEVDAETSESTEVPPAAEAESEVAQEVAAEGAAEQPAEGAAEQSAEGAAEQPAEGAAEQPAEGAAEQPAEVVEIVVKDPMESHAETPATPSKLFVIPHALPQVIRYVPSYYMAQRPLGSGYFYIY